MRANLVMPVTEAYPGGILDFSGYFLQFFKGFRQEIPNFWFCIKNSKHPFKKILATHLASDLLLFEKKITLKIQVDVIYKQLL